MTHTVTPTWTRNNETVAKAVALSLEGEQNFDVTVNASTTDKEVDCVLDVSEMSLLFIHSDKDITIETNSGSSPGNTLTIKSDKPLLWYKDCGMSNPLTTDVTALFITNGGASAATVKIRTGYDATP